HHSSTLATCSLLLSSPHHRPLHSFPTRRSSDLAGPYQGLSPAPDLNLLIAPAFAWLYKQTGDVTYRDRADAIFVGGVTQAAVSRSEEHTSELQSRFDLVCRLLLEKKNTNCSGRL